MRPFQQTNAASPERPASTRTRPRRPAVHRCRRFTQPVAKQRTELTGDLLCRRYQCPNSRGVVLFKRPHHGRVEHLPGFHAELEALHSDPTNQILPAGEQAEPWPFGAVFVETGGSEIDAELQRPRLTDSGRTLPSGRPRPRLFAGFAQIAHRIVLPNLQ
jgi:hypothetical protein